MKKRNLSLFLCLGMIISGCSGRQKTVTHNCGHERLHATLWVQESAEYKVICETVYRQAADALEELKNDPSVTAALEQKDDYSKLPAAIVLDLDETVLDNLPFQSQIVLNRSDFDPEAWKRWALKACAKAVPGAVDFLKYADTLGIEIFYLSNRNASEEEATIKNLRDLSIPVNGPSHVLLRSEDGHPEWGSDKTSRRSFIAKNYRIIMLIGDDLNDFLQAKGKDSAACRRMAQIHMRKFGKIWFLLPNPLYGSWEAGLFGGKYIKDTQKEREIKIGTLRGFEKVTKPN